jgi:dTDP-glucose pyrophosphorylase
MNRNILINEDISFAKAIKKLNETGERCLIVVDANKNLIGSLSDGDVRKSLFKGNGLRTSIKKFINRECLFCRNSDLDIKKLRKIMIEKRIYVVPVINNANKVIRIINIEDLDNKNFFFNKSKIKNIGVIIMAGGLGTRMKPFTNILPKPLLPIKNKTVIDHIIENFISIGFKEINLSINYKSKILKAYFEEKKHDIKINYLEEIKPLGTAGCLKLINKNKYSDLFVVNCDTISNFNLTNPIFFHKTNNNDLTLFCSEKRFKVPYGVVSMDKDNFLQDIKEKPQFNYFINLGMYIFKSSLLDLIPKNQIKFDFDYFINLLKKDNKIVSLYPVDENSWFDVGKWDDYKNFIDQI